MGSFGTQRQTAPILPLPLGSDPTKVLDLKNYSIDWLVRVPPRYKIRRCRLFSNLYVLKQNCQVSVLAEKVNLFTWSLQTCSVRLNGHYSTFEPINRAILASGLCGPFLDRISGSDSPVMTLEKPLPCHFD